MFKCLEEIRFEMFLQISTKRPNVLDEEKLLPRDIVPLPKEYLDLRQIRTGYEPVLFIWGFKLKDVYWESSLMRSRPSPTCLS